MKKIVGFILAIVFSFVFMGCSANVTPYRDCEDDEQPVAELTIHTFDGAYGSIPLVANFGHSFLSVKNLTDNIIFAGKFPLFPDEEVAIGTWGASSHFGVWYNLEAYYYELGKYDTCVTLTKNINDESIEKLNEFIIQNDTWKFFFNCSEFAVAAWNTVSLNETINISGLANPIKLKKKIKEFVDWQGMRPIKNFTSCGFYEGDQLRIYVLED